MKSDYKTKLELKQQEILNSVNHEEATMEQLQECLFKLNVIQKYYNKKIKTYYR